MINKYPLLVLVLSMVTLAFSAWLGATKFGRLRAQIAEQSDEFGIIQGATLTLLGLIIGFTFAMAVSRYDQRKNYEEEEANAIGTEYLRVDVLPAAESAKMKQLLIAYTEQRVLYYTTRDLDRLAEIDAETARLQQEMWKTVTGPAMAQPNALTGLALAGMNDVINTQGYTQAAWWNRIPRAAWALMFIMAIFTTGLVGMGTKTTSGFRPVLLVLPVIISIAFFLIADIDSPRRGVIRVAPQNMLALAASLKAS